MLKDKKSPSDNLIFVDVHWGKSDQDEILKARDRFQELYTAVKPTQGFMGKDLYRPMHFRIHNGDTVITKHYKEWTLDEVNEMHMMFKRKGGRPKWNPRGPTGANAQAAGTGNPATQPGTSDTAGAMDTSAPAIIPPGTTPVSNLPVPDQVAPITGGTNTAN